MKHYASFSIYSGAFRYDDDGSRLRRVLIFRIFEIWKLTYYNPAFAAVKAGFLFYSVSFNGKDYEDYWRTVPAPGCIR